MTRILVTGGAGFVGSNLCRILTHAPEIREVRVLDDLSSGSLENITALPVAMVEADIRDYRAVLDASRGIDAIIHLAAIASVPASIEAPRITHDVNMTGTLNVLEAARVMGVEKVVVASSSAVYGNNPSTPKNEDDWTTPISPYGVSKLAAECYAAAYRASYGLDAVAFRFFNIYGPGQPADHPYAAVIPKFIDAALNDRAVQIHGDGKQLRDFTYVDTICETLKASIVSGVSSDRPVNLAYNQHFTILHLLDEIETVLGRSIAREFVAPRPGDIKISQSETSRLKQLIPGIMPMSLRDGLSATVAWYRDALTPAGVGLAAGL